MERKKITVPPRQAVAESATTNMAVNENAVTPVRSESPNDPNRNPSADRVHHVSDDEMENSGVEVSDSAGQEPWPEPVNGSELIAELIQQINRFLALPQGAPLTIALWAVFSYTINAFEIAPRLHFWSPEKRCGKTTALKVLRRLIRNPQLTASISTSALFRTIARTQPTLVVDEGETFLRGDDEMKGILNAAHERELAFVTRSVQTPDGWNPQRFSTWTPMAIASIGKLWPTFEDRAIPIEMRRRRPSEHVEKARRRALIELQPLARKCARWALDNLQGLRDASPEIPEALDDRAGDNWEPLLAIADRAGGRWSAEAREVAQATSAEQRQPDSLGTMLLRDLRQVFREQGSPPRLNSQLICTELAKIEGSPWGEISNGKKITPHRLARLLGPFGVAPRSDGAARGYALADFADAFARYAD